VRLYGSQNLRDDGGITRLLFREKYDSESLGKNGKWSVRSFVPTSWELIPTGPFSTRDLTQLSKEHPAFALLRNLVELDLLSLVPHLCESEEPDSEIMHPVPLSSDVEGESELTYSAKVAAASLLPAAVRAKVLNTTQIAVPISSEYPRAAVVGILRLRHRPRTARTSAWFAEFDQQRARYQELYENIAAKMGRQPTKTELVAMFPNLSSSDPNRAKAK
jgi:hypothetical protein